MPSNNERDELHKAIWSIADDLRGSVDVCNSGLQKD